MVGKKTIKTIRIVLITTLCIFLYGVFEFGSVSGDVSSSKEGSGADSRSITQTLKEGLSGWEPQWLSEKMGGFQLEDPPSAADNWRKMENAISCRSESVELPLPLFTQEDLLSMDYGCFWLKSFSYCETGNKATYYFDYYDITWDELDQMKHCIDETVNEITSGIPGGAGVWEKSKAVHDELCRRISYDRSLSLPHCHDCYGALINHQAVCSGYASAYQLILARLGVPCCVVGSGSHVWNCIDVPSRSCFVDVTWDDMDQQDRYGREYISYNYFFLTPEEMGSIEDHTLINASLSDAPSGAESYNYYDYCGYCLSEYNVSAVKSILAHQIRNKANALTLRFEQGEDYQRALHWFDQDAKELFSLLCSAGYSTRGKTVSWICNSALHTITILL